MRTSLACWASIAAIWAACDRQPAPSVGTPASPIPALEVVRVVASESGSTGTHHGVLRAVNQFAAPIPSPDHEVQLDGQPVLATFDTFGYADLEAPGPGVVRVDGVEAPVLLHTFDAPWVMPDLHPAWPGGFEVPSAAVPSHDGVLVAAGSELWWAGPGTPAHRVLAAPAPIVGVRARHADLDGVIDAVAWGGDTVFVLQGRLDGGYGFGGAWQAPGYTVGGADVGDLDGDGSPDLAVAWSGAAPVLDAWTGDGRLGFAWSGSASLDAPPADLTVQDADARGSDQATVLHEGGREWSRFVVTGGTVVPIGPDMPALDPPPPGSSPRLLPTGDVNADSADEITVVSGGDVALLDVAVQDDACRFELDDAQCEPVVDYVRNPRLTNVTHADGNDDRLDDLWIVDESGELIGSYFFAPQQTRFGGPLLALPTPGPLAVYDADGDGSPDVTLATPGRAYRWGGRARPNDTVVMWSPRTLLSVIARARVAEFGLYEVDGVPTTNELVIVTNENGDTRLKVVQYTHGEGRAAQLGAVVLVPDKVTPDDFEMCGTNAWFALDGRAWRVDVSDPAAGIAITGLFGTRVTAVDCLITPDATYAAYLDGPEVVVLVSGSPPPKPQSVPGSGDLALGFGAEGLITRTCEAPCSIAWWPYGDDGQALFAESNPAGTYLDGVLVGPHTGALSVHDVDGNGRPDLVGLDPEEKLIFVHRSTGASAAPVSLWHAPEPIVGRIRVGDGSGDGLPDLWMVDQEGELRFAQPPPVGP